MAPLFRRNSSIQCFFCHSPVITPQNPTNFRCPACGCWNRYNNKGEILSDEPAMHEEFMNRKSFAKRASPSKDQLPNLHRNGPFCHECQMNQMLLMNLLSNYLPPPESPEHQQRVEMFPKYKESLYARYPPVCDSCRPAVEEEIHSKEQMARRKALNGWLKGGKERHRRVSGTPAIKDMIVVKSVHWRIRGALWLASAVTSIALLVLGLISSPVLGRLPNFLSTALPFLTAISLLWTAWDPNYITVQRAQLQGRAVRIHGKRNYIICQMLAWLSRLILSTTIYIRQNFLNPPTILDRYHLFLPVALLTELLALFSNPLFLRVQHPPPIRLIDTHSHLGALSRSVTPATTSSRVSTPLSTTLPKPSEQDLLASLSLSSKPVLTPPLIPVFGLPSLGPSTSSLKLKVEDEDAMDWSPINQGLNGSARSKPDENSSWLRPQRFFAPERPTGLENLFARTNLEDDVMQVDQEEPAFNALSLVKSWRQWYLPVIITILSMLVAYLAFWLVRRRTSSGTHSYGEL